MKVIKPLKLGLLYRTFEAGERCYLSTGLLTFFSFAASEPVIETEIDLWKYAAKALGPEAVIDLGMPKARGEVLITGRYFAPDGAPTPAGRVACGLGAIRKTLYIFGDRFWRRGRSGAWVITDPLPMARMDIMYPNAFGGEGYAPNPIGKGAAPVASGQGDPAWPLPNIEDPRRLIGSQADRPPPAGFGPLDLTWAERFSKAGTYDQEWLQTRFPGFAADMDWTIFNAAPADQQIEGWFSGDEPFEIDHMHPDRPHQQGRLPGIRPRCFMNRMAGPDPLFEEIPAHLETVWLFPEEEKGLMIHRGVAEVADPDADDVLHLLIAFESMADAPRPDEHYRRALANRLDPEKGAYYSLRETDLMPDGERSGLALLMEESEEGQLQASDNILAGRLQEKAKKEAAEAQARAAALGLDPAAGEPDAMPSEELSFDPTDIDAVIDHLDAILAEAERREAESLSKTRTLLQELGFEGEAALKEAAQSGGGRPAFSPEETIARLRELGLDNPELEQKLHDAKALLDQSYRRYGQYFPPADRPAAGDAAGLRALVTAGFERGDSLAGMDLTGADLSGLQLAGIDLKNAFLEGVDLSGSNLQGADLSGCVLVRGRLAGTRFTSAEMEGSNLGDAEISGADFTGADLRQAVLTRARVSGSVFRKATMDDADLSETVMDGVDFSGAAMPKARFIEARLSGALFAGAVLREALFLNTTLQEVDFSEADLTAGVLVGAQCEQVSFRGADLSRLCTAGENALNGAGFEGSRLAGANLRGLDLSGARLDGADLSRADLSQCNLQGASLARAKAVEARFVKTDLTGADLSGINLREGSLQRACLFEAGLQGANLYGVDFMKARFRNTDLRGSLLRKVFLDRWIKKRP
ncbi:DUF2169 family type VI secretion system accessory protein [Desulfatiglans anilini]|uniref:DUF2169 family type VI secretion system accessory protein n=1 Tax=Desulfatiglans anilini TaxID=90728 RepID=UPI0004054498|nr:DUF2169 domain-containing protein [Desulfatiglans anilini]